MGVQRATTVSVRLSLVLTVGLFVVAGCQMAPVASNMALVEHRQQVDSSGLVAPEAVEPLKASIAPPAAWQALKIQKTLLYTHQQWRSPSKRTAVGITYIRLPFPVGTSTVAFFAKKEAAKRSITGKLTRNWTDSLGREWFEGETDKYHITGYVLVRGLDAWINYCGYRVKEEKMAGEIELSQRALDTVLPLSAAAVADSASARADAAPVR